MNQPPREREEKGIRGALDLKETLGPVVHAWHSTARGRKGTGWTSTSDKIWGYHQHLSVAPLYTAPSLWGVSVCGVLSQELLSMQVAIACGSLAWHNLQARAYGSWGWPSSLQQTINPALTISGISLRDQCFHMLQGLICFSPLLAKPLLHAKGAHQRPSRSPL